MTHAPELEALLEAAGLPNDAPVESRRIGTDDAMVDAIIERIAIGEKTMTYSLPWLAEHDGRTPPEAGRLVAVLDARGRPALLLRLTGVDTLAFGEVGPGHIQREGIPMRDIDAWRPLHIAVWDEKLGAIGRRVSDDMPVWAEYFDLLAGGVA